MEQVDRLIEKRNDLITRNMAEYVCAKLSMRDPSIPKKEESFMIKGLSRQWREDKEVIRILQKKLDRMNHFYSKITSEELRCSAGKGRRYSLQGYEDVNVDIVPIDRHNFKCFIYSPPYHHLTIGVIETIDRLFPKLNSHFGEKSKRAYKGWKKRWERGCKI